MAQRRTRGIDNMTRNEIYEIAKSYATSCDEITAAPYCRRFGISAYVFYRCLEKAVVESIVSEDTAKKIAQKSSRNSYHHAGDGARIQSLSHYQKLMDEREKFRFKPKDQKKYVEMYAESLLNLEDFAKIMRMSRALLTKALFDAVQGLVVDDECVEKLYEKSKARYGAEVADPFFAQLREARAVALQAKKDHERELREARKLRKQQKS